MKALSLPVIVLTVLLVGPSRGEEKQDEARQYWIYEGGWLAQAKDGSWYELNEDSFRTTGKPWTFLDLFDQVEVLLEVLSLETRVVSAHVSG